MKIKEEIKSKRGGIRQGSGAKPKYNEPTVTITFRVPKSKAQEVKDIVKGILKNNLKNQD